MNRREIYYILQNKTFLFIFNLGQRRVFFSNQVTYPTDLCPCEVVSADVNGDNQTDIIVVNSNSNHINIFLNQGNGTFNNQAKYSTGNNPNPLATADLNNDNKPDLIIPNYSSNTISVLLNYVIWS